MRSSVADLRLRNVPLSPDNEKSAPESQYLHSQQNIKLEALIQNSELLTQDPILEVFEF